MSPRKEQVFNCSVALATLPTSWTLSAPLPTLAASWILSAALPKSPNPSDTFPNFPGAPIGTKSAAMLTTSEPISAKSPGFPCFNNSPTLSTLFLATSVT